MAFKRVKVSKDRNGWGGPLILQPDEKKKYVISVTGGGIHPVAKRIAELSGTIAVDAFENPVERDETLVAVIDCGGTARCGTYPRLGIPTANVKVQEPSGPLSKFMTEDIFVSGVSIRSIEADDEVSVSSATDIPTAIKEKEEEAGIATSTKKPDQEESVQTETRVSDNEGPTGFMGLIDKIGRGAGTFINIMYQAGRDTVDSIVRNIIPFMAFVATLVGIINYTGVGDLIATVLTPLAGSLVGLIILGFITALPFLSPLLAPGAVIAAIVGTLIGQQISSGAIPAHYALPALFAINAQVGMDFIPVGMTLGEAEPETIAIGTPAILFSRVITGPLAVVIAYGVSLFM